MGSLMMIPKTIMFLKRLLIKLILNILLIPIR